MTYFWLDLPPTHIIPKLISVSSFMAHWGRNLFREFRDKVKKQKEVLASLINHTGTKGIKKYFVEKDKLNDLLFHEEVYWK